jgi:hypothetical protein
MSVFGFFGGNKDNIPNRWNQLAGILSHEVFMETSRRNNILWRGSRADHSAQGCASVPRARNGSRSERARRNGWCRP